MRNFLLFLTLFFPITTFAQTKESISGYCERGGETVTTDGRQSTTRVQRSFSSCTITVYYAGTNQLATIYPSSASPSVKSNPFIADTDGYWQFYALPGRYDVRFSGTGIPTPFTRAGYWISQGGGSSVPTCSTSQLLYYAATGSAPICLTLGTNLSITSGVLNAAGGGGSTGSGTVGEGSRFQFAYYPSSGTSVVGYPNFTATSLGGINYFDFTGQLRNIRNFTAASSTEDYSLISTLNLSTSSATNAVLAAIRANLSSTSGTYNSDTSGYLSSVSAGVNSTLTNLNGYISKLQGAGASGTVWSGFRSAYSHNSNTVPGSVNSFYSEPPVITLGTLPSFTAFHAVAPASLSSITNYRAFYSSGGSSQFQKTFATDAVQFLNGMTAQFFAPNSNAYAAWGFNPATTPVGSYTYLFPNSVPLASQYLTVASVDATNVQLQWTNAAATGSVTEVGLAAPNMFTISNSPVTTSGTLTLGLASQSPNRIFASPNGTSGVPTFRELVAGDIPNLSATYQAASATLSQFASLNPADKNLLQFNSGAWTTRTPAQIKTDLQLGNVENVALSTWTGSTNLTTFGTISSGTWEGSVISSTKGGAGAVNGIMKANGSGVVSAATPGSDYEVPLTAGTGLTRATNTLSVNTTQNITRLSNLTANGLIRTSGGDGTLSIASAGTDYAPATSGNSILRGNNSGGFSSVTIGSGLLYDSVTGELRSTTAGGSVTSVGVVTANGFSGSVLNPTTNAQISLFVNASGMLKGNGLAISAATAGTDYVAPGSFLTSGLTLDAGTFLLGRTSASAGAPQQFNVGTGLQIVAGAALQTNPVQDNITTLSTLASASAGYVKASTTGLLSKVSNSTLTSELDLFTSSLKGAVPASGGGTTNFLRADGTWAAPPSGGGGGTFNPTAGRIPFFTGSAWADSPFAIGTSGSTITATSGSATSLSTPFLSVTKDSSATGSIASVMTLNANYSAGSVSAPFGGSISMGAKILNSASPVQIAQMDWVSTNNTPLSPSSYLQFNVTGGQDTALFSALRVFPSSISVGGDFEAGRVNVANSDLVPSAALAGTTLTTVSTGNHPGGGFGVFLPHNYTSSSDSLSWQTSPGLWWVPANGSTAGYDHLAGFWHDKRSSTKGFNLQGALEFSRFTLRSAGGTSIGNKLFEFDLKNSNSDSQLNIYFNGSNATAIRFYEQDQTSFAGLQAPTNLANTVTYTFPSSKPSAAAGDAYDILASSGEGGLIWVLSSGTGNIVRSSNPTLTRPRISVEAYNSFASIASPPAGMMVYCTNCAAAPVCSADSGTGALAVYANGAWRCQ